MPYDEGLPYLDEPDADVVLGQLSQFVQFTCHPMINDGQLIHHHPLPLGFLFNPTAPSADTTPSHISQPVQCTRCSAFINPWCSINSKSNWVCRFCGAVQSALSSQYAKGDWSNFAELTNPVFDFFLSSQKLPNPNSTRIFIIDTASSASALKRSCAAVRDTIRSLSKSDCEEHSNMHIAIISFDESVTLWTLDRSSPVNGLSFSGAVQLTQLQRELLSARRSRFIVPVTEDTLSAAEHVLTSINMSAAPKSRRAVATAVEVAACLFSGPGVDLSTHQYFDENGVFVPRYRYNGGIGRCFLALMVSGAPTLFRRGVESEEQIQDYVEKLSSSLCALCGISGVEVFTLSNRQIGVSFYKALSLKPGGSLISGVESLEYWACAALGSGAMVSFSTSPGLQIDQVIGSAWGAHGDDCVRMNVGQWSNNCFCFYLSAEDGCSLVGDYSLIQLSLRWIDAFGRLRVRVFTVPLPLTGNKLKWIQGINTPVSVVLLAKQIAAAALEAQHEVDSDVLIESVEATMMRVLRAYPSLPESVATLPYYMYLLQRSALCGATKEHPEDLALQRLLFLARADLQDSLLTLRPRLWLVVGTDESPKFALQEIPIEDMSLSSDSVLCMQTISSLMLWIGDRVRNQQAQDFGHQQLLLLKGGRFPVPKIMTFREGESMARWLESRLIPSHKDSLEQQMASFPHLAQMTTEQRTQLLAKFPRTDELSFNQWSQRLYRKLNK